MEKFNKKTLILLLASIIPVATAFATEQYKNSLMSLSFENGSNGAVNLILHTRNQYSGNITPTRKDANTYVIILPEINNLAATPSVETINSLESVSIKTMPYSQSGKGYTRIVLKTHNPIQIYGHNKIFDATEINKNTTNTSVSKNTAAINTNQTSTKPSQSVKNTNRNNRTSNQQEKRKQKQQTIKQDPIEQQTNITQNNSTDSFAQQSNTIPNNKDNNDALLFALGFILVIMIFAFLYSKAKNKMHETMGENFVIDLDEDSSNSKKKNSTLDTLTNEINKLDKKYPNVISTKSHIKNYETQPIIPQEKLNTANIINLDALFEQQNNEQDTKSNNDLDNFLEQYYIESNQVETTQETISEKVELYNQELFDKIINSTNIQFDNNDVNKIKSLTNIEISDNIKQEIKTKFHSNPQKKKPSQQVVLESMILEYSLERDIRFDSDDIMILNKLMSVEIDPDFITDLRTNPQKTAEIEQNILNYNGEEERKKHFTKKYLNGYEVEILNVKDELPDLQDVLKNPDKYAEPVVKPAVADESVLMKNIENVIFKPFDDGTNSFEIINKPEDYKKQDSEEKPKIITTEKIEQNKKQINIKPVKTSINIKKNNETLIKNKLDKDLSLKNKQETSKKQEPINFYRELDGISYNIIATTELTPNIGCYLAKYDNKFVVLGYVLDELVKIKDLDETITKPSIQSRLKEEIDETTSQYIVRVGHSKFVLNINDCKIEYVMDL